MTHLVNEKSQKVIQNYMNIKLGNKFASCPYYINLSKKKDLRVMMGKGDPSEIEMEAKIWAKIKGIDFKSMSEEQLREFLIDRGIGIDCSGFVVHVLDGFYKYKTGKHIWRKLKVPEKDFWSWLKFILRPVEKLGANILTNSENAFAIEIKDVRPGDVIRCKWKKKNSHHILLVTEVDRNNAGEVTKIGYTHSTPFYGDANGVRHGEIIINNQNEPLEKQKWTEVDENGVNFTFEGYLVMLEDNGLRRLKVLEKLI